MSAKIILLNPITSNGQRVLRTGRCQQKAFSPIGIWPPIALLETAAALKNKGFDKIEIIDGEVEGFSFKGLVNKVAEKNPDFVILHNITPTIYDDLLFSRLLKEKVPNADIVFIGPHATVFPQNLLSEKHIDYVVLGEPQDTISEFIDARVKKNNLSSILGLAYKECGKIKVNKRRPAKKDYDYPYSLNRSLLKNEKYIMPFTGKIFTVIKTSRGCDFSCSFCTSASYYGKGWRGRSPDNIIEEIRDVKQNYCIDTFLFLSDTFNGRKGFVKELAKKIIDEGLNIKWVSNVRIDLIDSEDARLMKESGCMLVSLGIESYDRNILEKNKKHIDPNSINKGIGHLNKYGIKTYGYFILGLKGENINTALKTALKAAFSRLDFAYFYFLTPYPGTEYFAEFECRRWRQYFHGISNIVSYPNLNKWSIAVLRYLAFMLFYIRPKRLFISMAYYVRTKLC